MAPELASLNDKMRKATVMPFMKSRKEQALEAGPDVLDVRLPFDEAGVRLGRPRHPPAFLLPLMASRHSPLLQLFKENIDYLMRALSLDSIQASRGGQGNRLNLTSVIEPCSPPSQIKSVDEAPEGVSVKEAIPGNPVFVYKKNTDA